LTGGREPNSESVAREKPPGRKHRFEYFSKKKAKGVQKTGFSAKAGS